ncbi:MAG TPA: rod shape-determining protein MreC [Flavobacteriaceae bacterium]|nr:rod shape-determining protein MreC [Flavobacteriaceae bacterium]
MQQIIYLIRKFRYFLLLLCLEVIAFIFIVQHHSYHKSKFVNSANAVTGSVYKKLNSVTEFFHLKEENKLLNEENVRLKNLIELTSANDSLVEFKSVNDTVFNQKYTFTSAKIINNNYHRRNNVLTLNKGSKHGLSSDLGVVNSKGVIGVVKSVSKNFATVLSILNNYSQINVKLKNSSHFGTMVWDGKNYNVVQLTDIPRQAEIKIGDSIITGGKSAIFPEGIPVGKVKDFNFENNQYKQINVELFNDMSAIGNVKIIKNLLRNEQLQLEQDE